MKITKSQLKQIIKEELEAVVRENYGLEGKMAQGQLRRIGELANMIAAQFDDGSNLEEWVEAKITKSQDYLSSVMNYMRGQSFPKARPVHTIKGNFPELSELEEVQSAALTQQVAHDKAKEEEAAARRQKAADERAKTGGEEPYMSALSPAEAAKEILAKRAKPKIKFTKGGIMVSRVPVAKFGESLEKISKSQLKQIIKEELESALNEWGSGLGELIRDVADDGLKQWGGERSDEAVSAARKFARKLVRKADVGDFDRLEEIAEIIAERLKNLFG